MRNQRAVCAVLACALLIGLQSLSRADSVTFKNGDHISGTIGLIEGEKFTITTDLAAPAGAPLGAGKMTLVFKWSDVATFTTDKPIEIRLKDGTVLKSVTTGAAKAGAVDLKSPMVVTPAKTATSQPSGEVAFKDVKIINAGYGEVHGNVAVGGMMARGNTYSDNFNASTEMTRRTADDLFVFDAQYMYGDQKAAPTYQKTVATDNWFMQAKYDYSLNDKLYAFVIDRLDKDRIALVSIRDAASVGLGYNWYATDTFNLWTEAGPGYFYEKFVTGGTDEHVTARLAYHVDKTIGNFMLFHTFQYFPSLKRMDDYFITTDAGVQLNMTPKLFSQFKVQLNHMAKPAPGSQRDDTLYVLSVGYNF